MKKQGRAARLDFKYMSSNVEELEKNLKNRRMVADVAGLVSAYSRYRTLTAEILEKRSKRNSIVDQVNAAVNAPSHSKEEKKTVSSPFPFPFPFPLIFFLIFFLFDFPDHCCLK